MTPEPLLLPRDRYAKPELSDAGRAVAAYVLFIAALVAVMAVAHFALR